MKKGLKIGQVQPLGMGSFNLRGVMRSTAKAILFLVLLTSAGAAQAGQPLQVAYSNKVTTNFKWHWPQQTRRTANYLQTKPYYYTGRMMKYAGENVSKYRHHYQHKTPYRDWGYYFKKGDRLAPHQVVYFGPLQPQNYQRGAVKIYQ